jgi:hypothetical protein
VAALFAAETVFGLEQVDLRWHRSVSLGGWFGFQLHLQREMAIERCLSVLGKLVGG